MRVAVGDDDAGRRLVEHVGRRAAYEDVALVDALVGGLADAERPEVPASETAAELAAVVDVHGLAARAQAEVAREERASVLARGAAARGASAAAAAADAAELEYVGVLKEEVALLGEEQAETRQVDLAVVDLGRREVRVERQRGVRRRRDLVEDVERGLEARAAVGARPVHAPVGHAERRHDVEPEPLLEPFEADGRPGDARVHLPVARHPAYRLVVALDRALEVDAPGLAARIERDRLEGDPHLGRPAGGVDRHPGVPRRIEVALQIRRVLIEGFPAHAVRVDLESVAAAAVEVRVEYDREAVLAAEPSALAQHLRGDRVRAAVPQPRGDVERLVRVEETDLGRLGRLGILDGLELVEVFDERGP